MPHSMDMAQEKFAEPTVHIYHDIQQNWTHEWENQANCV